MAGLCLLNQSWQTNLKRFGNPGSDIKCRISNATLDHADVRWVQSGCFSEFLLGQASRHPAVANGHSKMLGNITGHLLKLLPVMRRNAIDYRL
jgi:hypothetical protein